jgi:hypothetical protein
MLMSSNNPGSQGDKEMLNTETLTMKATSALLALDKTFIGTDDYMGMAYFWSYEYRHYMRPMTYAVNRRVHQALRAAGLAVDGDSAEHLAIILKKINLRQLDEVGDHVSLELARAAR